MVENVTNYFAQAIPGDEELMSIFDYRGAEKLGNGLIEPAELC